MTTDEMCLELANGDFLEIDFKKGIVYSRRFANKEIGCINTKGYIVSTLHLNGERKQIKLHRLIWIAKYGLIPKGYILDHKNRIKSDNRIINLRLADGKLNAKNRRSYLGENNPSVKINFKIAEKIRSEYLEIKSYSELAKTFKVSKSLIAQIIRKEIWKIN